jgi:hypothetical protein
MHSQKCNMLHHHLKPVAAIEKTGMDLYETDSQRSLVQCALSQDSSSRSPQDISMLLRLTAAFNAFSSLPHDLRAELCRHITFKAARKGEVIIKEGDSADCMQAILFIHRNRPSHLFAGS